MAALNIMSSDEDGRIRAEVHHVDDKSEALAKLVEWFTNSTIATLIVGSSAPVLGYVRDFLADWNILGDDDRFDMIYDRFSGGSDRIVYVP